MYYFSGLLVLVGLVVLFDGVRGGVSGGGGCGECVVGGGVFLCSVCFCGSIVSC